MTTDFWPRLLEWFGGIALVTAALAWLTKSIVSHWLSKDVETYKAVLKRNADIQTEDFKTRLQILAKEHDVRFSKLHEKRAEIIAQLYYLLESADTTVSLFQRILKLRDEGKADTDGVGRWEAKATEATQLLSDFVQRHQLYFGEQLAKEIKGIMFALNGPIGDFAVHRIRAKSSAETLPAPYREITEKWEQERDQIRRTKTMIEIEFRKILGSDIS